MYTRNAARLTLGPLGLVLLLACAGGSPASEGAPPAKGPYDGGGSSAEQDGGGAADAGTRDGAPAHIDAAPDSADAPSDAAPDRGDVPGDAAPDGAAPTPPFPRLAGYPIGGPQATVKTAAFHAWAAKQSLVILTQWPGWQSSGMTMADVMKDIKARSTIGTKLVVYVDMNEIAKSAANGGAEAFEYAAIAQAPWFLYTNGAARSGPVDSWYDPPNYAAINFTTYAPQANGTDFMQWFTDYSIGFIRDGASPGGNANAANPYVDGFFMDNFNWQERIDGDWNLDGTVDSAKDPTVRGWTQAAHKAYVDYVRAKWPGSVQLGNVADWASSEQQYSQPVGPTYDQLLDGGVLESMIGETWSYETWAGFDVMMQAYRTTIDALRAPKIAIFGLSSLAATDYATMRYGLTATLMDDAYFYPSGVNGYSPDDQFWFDEFGQNLGGATQPRQEAAWKQGVWRRDFANGIALCNPKGNGTQTVTLGGTFHKVKGAQAPSVNDGSTVTSVTISERHGIVLLR
jgi:hypothetical protein